jgi:hypothetical protein
MLLLKKISFDHLAITRFLWRHDFLERMTTHMSSLNAPKLPETHRANHVVCSGTEIAVQAAFRQAPSTFWVTMSPMSGAITHPYQNL